MGITEIGIVVQKVMTSSYPTVRIAVPVKGTVMEIETDETGKSIGRIGIYLQEMDKPAYTFTKAMFWGLTGADSELVIEGDLQQSHDH